MYLLRQYAKGEKAHGNYYAGYDGWRPFFGAIQYAHRMDAELCAKVQQQLIRLGYDKVVPVEEADHRKVAFLPSASKSV